MTPFSRTFFPYFGGMPVASVGSSVGASVGASVGLTVGALVGAAVGAVVGAVVGAGVVHAASEERTITAPSIAAMSFIKRFMIFSSFNRFV
ncbi:MAG: hypothetical protein J5794_02695 [Lachnospiraceae bacterium]|nr:hypothetical protein [Lachnospiraceae bacterium]